MIRKECVEKILSLGENQPIRKAFLQMFEQMAKEADKNGDPASTVILQLYDEDSKLQPGDWAPELYLVLRKVEDVKTEDANTDSSDEVDSNGTEESSP